MRSWIFYFLPLIFSIYAFSEEVGELPYSTPDQLVSLTHEMDKIGGIISPLSGQPILRQIDLVAKGAQDVLLKRIFVSQHRDWHANQSLLISKGLRLQPQVLESGWVIFPHTTLDYVAITKTSHHRKSYPQVREFDATGKPTRTIDFTDHGRPHDHPNPHQHRNLPNSTGGTPNRHKPEPVPEWSYE